MLKGNVLTDPSSSRIAIKEVSVKNGNFLMKCQSGNAMSWQGFDGHFFRTRGGGHS